MDSKENLDKLIQIIKEIIAVPENAAFTNTLKSYFLSSAIEKNQGFYENIYVKVVEEKTLSQAKDFYKNFKYNSPFFKKNLEDKFVIMMQAYRANRFIDFLEACYLQIDEIINYLYKKEDFKNHILKFRMQEVAFFHTSKHIKKLPLEYVLFWKYNEELSDNSTFNNALKYEMTSFKKDIKWHKYIAIKAVCHYLFYSKNLNEQDLYDVYDFNSFFEKIYTIYTLKKLFNIKDKNNDFIDAPIPKSVANKYEEKIKYILTSREDSYMYILGLFQEIIDELSIYVNQ